MPKLNQVLAIEKQTKASAAEQVTQIYHTLQKENLLAGLSKTYKSNSEDGERFPPESQQVQLRVKRALSAVANALGPVMNATASRDLANCEAKADVVVDGKTILSGVPAVTLLWLEKQLVDIHTLILKLPSLPQTETWTFDTNQDCYATAPVETVKTKKIAKPFVKAEATKEHPAQVEVVHEDVIQGYWTTVKFSGAIPLEDKRVLRERCEALLAAVKFARETANLVDAPKFSVANEVFNFLFA